MKKQFYSKALDAHFTCPSWFTRAMLCSTEMKQAEFRVSLREIQVTEYKIFNRRRYIFRVYDYKPPVNCRCSMELNHMSNK